ncbi:MAG: hypothetical protein NTW60_04100 [Candidatus Wolfebacteria bacterium]|nr:hypothetical protein [Candidatus Wolfebacteria bacterium]
MPQIIGSIVNFVSENIFWLRFFSVFVAGIFIWLTVSMNIKIGLTREKYTHWLDVLSGENISKKRAVKAWKQVKKRLIVGGDTNLKLAILECDRVLSEILKASAFPGNNLDERLKNINESQIACIEELRQVHKIRNRIVAEPDFMLTKGEAEIAVSIYKKAFVELFLIEEED